MVGTPSYKSINGIVSNMCCDGWKIVSRKNESSDDAIVHFWMASNQNEISYAQIYDVNRRLIFTLQLIKSYWQHGKFRW